MTTIAEAIEEIKRLRSALRATVDVLEVLRRGHGAEVSAACFPALNEGREALGIQLYPVTQESCAPHRKRAQ